MSLENEDRSATNHVSEIGDDVPKHPKVSYTREFLLSLSQLEICQKLPTGFDQLILSELEDSSRGIPDRQKIHGSLPSQGFRRNDYSSSPPTCGDSDGNSRGIYGRWESRSSGRSDRDSDSQSDKDSALYTNLGSGCLNYGIKYTSCLIIAYNEFTRHNYIGETTLRKNCCLKKTMLSSPLMYPEALGRSKFDKSYMLLLPA